MALLQSTTDILQKGDSAPDFTLKNVDETTVSLKDFEGKPVLVLFMCNHCPYVKPKFNDIADLQNDYKDKIVVLCVNSNDPVNFPSDNFERMQELATEKGYKYYLFDETQEVAKEYGAVCTPDPFLFDKDHNLVYHGRINDAMEPGDPVNKEDMKEAIDALLSGNEIENWFVPSQGCSIKWKPTQR